MKAVVVLSGGQDSAICLAIAVKKHGRENVSAITFKYGQRHRVEVKYARTLAKHFGIAAHNVVELGFYSHLTCSALMDSSRRIERKKGASCPSTVVEGRNAIFLMAASVWAKSLGAVEVYTGVSEVDYSGYPDCRGEFVRAQQKAARLALDYPIKIITPLLKMTKADEWALADKLGVFDLIANSTVTCYNGIPASGCGRCPACKLRNAGLKSFLARSKKKKKKKIEI